MTSPPTWISYISLAVLWLAYYMIIAFVQELALRTLVFLNRFGNEDSILMALGASVILKFGLLLWVTRYILLKMIAVRYIAKAEKLMGGGMLPMIMGAGGVEGPPEGPPVAPPPDSPSSSLQQSGNYLSPGSGGNYL